jgi:hypothetical protein
VDWPYAHTLVDHFPIVLTVVGCGVLVLAFILERRGVWLYALATLTLAGVSAYPAFFTGDEAAHALRHTWYITRPAIEEHEEAADFALAVLLVMGAMTAFAWWRMLRREMAGLPSTWIRVAVAVLAALALGVVTRTAYLGGKIVHKAPLLLHAPGTVPMTSDSTNPARALPRTIRR